MEQVRDRLGMLCDQLSRFPDLHDIIRAAGAGGHLDKLLAALKGEDKLDENQVFAWLQAIDDACVRSGLAGITSRERAFHPLPPGFGSLPSGFYEPSDELPGGDDQDEGVSGSDPQAWVCPRGRCDRAVLPEEVRILRVCAAAGGTPMRPFTLPQS